MRFVDLTWPDIQEIPCDGVVVVIPIAACEQHSLHLPVFTDTILTTAIAEGLERALQAKVLLLPTQWLGASDHHLPFGGTLSAQVDRHIDLVGDLIRSVLKSQFTRIMILNGHGGNIDTMKVALQRLQPEFPDRLMTAATYWEVAEAEFAELGQGPRRKMGHACEYETSMIMALRPDLVRTDRIRNDDTRYRDEACRGVYVAEDMSQCTRQGAVGYPEFATAETGKALLEAAVKRLGEVVEALLRRPLPSTDSPLQRMRIA
ncbi:creatininase family protein [Telmatocola sphagniphila]|uniref:Creatininase family protein n=1 Tax=Telmatocola sphagniphila TaxID=1123043 RepID=A0A8E6EU15_9BACT|nr:creatininase family protein [Telmatocola sphagniphila]QVL30682.1 creatininase family protein [Telmatocola sphagniphila]